MARNSLRVVEKAGGEAKKRRGARGSKRVRAAGRQCARRRRARSSALQIRSLPLLFPTCLNPLSLSLPPALSFSRAEDPFLVTKCPRSPDSINAQRIGAKRESRKRALRKGKLDFKDPSESERRSNRSRCYREIKIAFKLIAKLKPNLN